jgi:hypothetical protein
MGDLSRTRLTDWDVTWGTYSLGYVDKVTPDLKIKTMPLKVGTLGDIEVGHRIIGLEGSIKVEVREIDFVMQRSLTPWGGTSGTVVNLMPTLPADLYDYAKALLLHPHDKGSDVSEDVHLLKTVPKIIPATERDGMKYDVWTIEFQVFFDRAQLPQLVYGTIGV